MNSQLIQTLTRNETEYLILNVLDEFDFEKAHKIIVSLNLNWDRLVVSKNSRSIKTEAYIPSIEEMREFAHDLLRTVVDTDMFDRVSHNYFRAEFHRSEKYLNLSFVVCESSAIL